MGSVLYHYDGVATRGQESTGGPISWVILSWNWVKKEYHIESPDRSGRTL